MTQPEYIGRPPSSPIANFQRWSATHWLIAINVAVYLLDLLAGGRLSEWGAFSAATAIYHLQIWRFLTFQFLHGGLMHILINMIVLFFFGPMLEIVLGKIRFVIFYLLCGFSGACLFVIMGRIGMLDISQWTSLVGASAGIFGVMVAAAVLTPNRPVQLLLFYVLPVTMRIRTMVFLLLGFAVVIILTSGANAGGEASHLGGAAMGFGLIHLWRRFAPKPKRHQFWQPGQENFLRDEFRQ